MKDKYIYILYTINSMALNKQSVCDIINVTYLPLLLKKKSVSDVILL